MRHGIVLLLSLFFCASLLAGCEQTEAGTGTADIMETENTINGEIQTGGVTAKTEDSSAYHTQEIWADNNGKQIYGIAYIPDDGHSTHPLVIFAHELGENHETGIPYAERLASVGYAVYTFDFCGGSTDGTENRSDGGSTEMSVKTEASDLESVMEAAEEWDFVDPERIALLGGSQGGFVSAIAAVDRPDDVTALILMYPAFVIYDDMHERFASLDEVPDTFGQWGSWITLGKIYVEDVWDYDPYEHIGNYEGPVMVLHGDADGLVNISYGERAAQVYRNAEFHSIENGGHGFYGQPFEDAVQYIEDFLARQMPVEG